MLGCGRLQVLGLVTREDLFRLIMLWWISNFLLVFSMPWHALGVRESLVKALLGTAVAQARDCLTPDVQLLVL